MFLVKGVLKICSKFTGEHPRQSVISMKKLLCNFIEIALRHGFQLSVALEKAILAHKESVDIPTQIEKPSKSSGITESKIFFPKN